MSFLLVKDVHLSLCVVEPGMIEDFFGGQAFRYVFLQHALHQVSCQLRNCVTILYLLLVKFMGQIADLVSLKRHIAVEDSVEADASRPDVYREALVANLLHDLGSNVCWCATLFKE